MAADGYIEYLLPEVFPSSFPDNKIMYQRSTVKWPLGQQCGRTKHFEDNGKQTKNSPKSYLERIHKEFKQDIILADGNFIFKKLHWRNIEDHSEKNEFILTPIRRLKGEELTRDALEFNKDLSDIRGLIERKFLLKTKFRRFAPNNKYRQKWETLVHHLRVACALENCQLVESNEAEFSEIQDSYFVREEVQEDESQDDEDISYSQDLFKTKFLLEKRGKATTIEIHQDLSWSWESEEETVPSDHQQQQEIQIEAPM